MIKTALLTLSMVTTSLMAGDAYIKCRFYGLYISEQKKTITFPREGGDMYFRVHFDGNKTSYVESYDTIPQARVKFSSFNRSDSSVIFKNNSTDAIMFIKHGGGTRKEMDISAHVYLGEAPSGNNVITAIECKESEKDARWKHKFPLL